MGRQHGTLRGRTPCTLLSIALESFDGSVRRRRDLPLIGDSDADARGLGRDV